MSAEVVHKDNDPRDNETIRAAWDEWNRNTPESFWDVAVLPRRTPGGIEPSIMWPVLLDVANRFEIWAHGYAAAMRDADTR